MASWDGGDASWDGGDIMREAGDFAREDADFFHPPRDGRYEIPQPPDPEHIHPDTEQNVQQQTEDVVTNFMYQQYRQVKTRQQYDAKPCVPEFSQMNREQGQINKTALIGRQLARIGDEIQDRYADEFDGMIVHLRIDKDNLYDTFTNVAKKMIASGLNWGRVVALLSFGFRMAMSALQNSISSVPGFLKLIVETIAKVFFQEKIVKWIADNGGWIVALTYNASASNLAMAFVGITAITSLAFVIYNRTFG